MARGKRPEAPREEPAQPHFEALRELVAVIEADGALVSLSPFWRPDASGVAPAHVAELLTPADRAGLGHALSDARAGRVAHCSARHADTGMPLSWSFAPGDRGRLHVLAGAAAPDGITARAIARDAGAGLALLDPEGRYVYVNDAYCRLYGYAPEELQGQVFSMVVAADDRARALANHRATVDGTSDDDERELRVVRKDGTPMLVTASSRRLALPGGRVFRLATVSDITDIRASEQRLAEAEARLRDITDSIPGAIFQLERRPDGGFATVFMSEGFRALTGVGAEVEISDFALVTGFIPEPHRSRAIALSEASARDLASYDQELPLEGPGGRVWVHARSQPHRRADGTIVWNGLMVDVTARHEARAEADRLNAILESTPDCVAITDTRGRLRYLNAGGHRLLGTDPQAPLDGRPFQDFLHPGDAKRVHTEAIPAAARRGSWEGEVTLVTAAGDEVPVSQTILCHRDASGRVARFSTIIRDLSERILAERALAASEARFRTLYDDTPVMLHSVDRDFRITGVNAHWLEVLGYRREEVVGRPLADFYSEKARGWILGKARPAFVENGYLRETPCQVLRRDGSVLDVLMSVNAVYDAGGGYAGALAAMTDITGQRRAEESYRELFDNATEGIYRATPAGRLLRANPALAHMHGFDHEDELLESITDIAREWYVDPGARARLLEVVRREGAVENFEAEILRRATGERIWTSENVRAVHDQTGEIAWLEGTIRDITQQVRARRLAERRSEILEMIARDHSLTGILYEIVDIVEQQFPHLTAAVFRLQDDRLYTAAAPGLSNTCIRAVDGARPADVGSAIDAALDSGRIAVDTELGRGTAGADAFVDAVRAAGDGAVTAVPVRDQQDATLGILAAFARHPRDAAGDDVAQLLREMGQIASIAMEQYWLSQELLRQAQYDPLTELPNRALLADRIEHAIHDAGRDGHPVGVLLLDLDEFKLVNDTLGHGAGDQLLQQVAGRLGACLRAGDTVARLGGDEFVVVVPLRDGADATDVAERVLEALQASAQVAAREVTARPSIGISLYPQDGSTPEALLQAADTAMYAAKHAGKNRFRYFAETMNEQMTERLRIETELRSALERSELVLHYQPRVDLTDGRIIGAEALLRWHHPERGLVPPGQFLPVAERGPLMGEIDLLVMRQAAARAAAWQGAGRDLLLSANLSTRELHAEGFATQVACELEAAGVDPSGLELEITESMLMQDFERATRQLCALKERAPRLRIAIDDFGSGYSSLNYLRHLPIDTLKIDRSFVADLTAPGSAKTARAIAKTITELGRNLGLRVVAEGVERREQAELLRRFRCHEAQGFWFDPALPADEFEGRLGHDVTPRQTAGNDGAGP